MKSQAAKGRSEREFAVGDMVYLKLQPYIQTSVAVKPNHKLAYRFFGPFRVLQRVGSVAYRLDLPSDSKIHPVVHVSQLKKHIAPHLQVSTDLTVIPDVEIDPPTPIVVLDTRMVSRGSSTTTQLLIQWSRFPSTMTTWEEQKDFCRRYSAAPACGQAGFRGGDSVMNYGISG
jgi:hypothetical protein